MNSKLLVGGVVLTLFAIGSERRLVLAHDDVPATRNVAAAQSSITDRVVSSVSEAFDAVVAEAVAKGVSNAEQVLQSYQPKLKALRGEEAQKAKGLAEEVAKACELTRAELTKGKTFVALDYAMQASRDLDELKKVFERR